MLAVMRVFGISPGSPGRTNKREVGRSDQFADGLDDAKSQNPSSTWHSHDTVCKVYTN